jgi:K+-transporting ATPase ATPase C chain
MRTEMFIALRVTLVTLLGTGLVYPLATTGAAQLLLPAEANGSLVTGLKGERVGSALIGQRFSRPEYFQPRPSAAGEGGWDASASSGSNLSTTSAKLRDRARADAERLARENPGAGPVPVELITTSASGLDPHVSPEAARWQIARVARARELRPDRVAAVVEGLVEGRELGLLGEPRVNVRLHTLEMDRRFGAPTPSISAVPARP